MRTPHYLIFLGCGGATVLLAISVSIAQIGQPRQLDVPKTPLAIPAVGTDAPDGKLTDKVGIFPPGFSEQASLMLRQYEIDNGLGMVQMLTYRGYQIIVPASLTTNIETTKREIDGLIAAQADRVPSKQQQNADKSEIQRLFGVDVSATYNQSLGAYVDNRGYQYKLINGVVVSKSVGVTDELRRKWLESHPHFNDGNHSGAALETLPDSALKNRAEEILNKTSSPIESVIQRLQQADWPKGKLQTAFDFGSVKVLVDRTSGEIIAYSNAIRQEGR